MVASLTKKEQMALDKRAKRCYHLLKIDNYLLI